MEQLFVLYMRLKGLNQITKYIQYMYQKLIIHYVMNYYIDVYMHSSVDVVLIV